jgi:hypothetical protein
MSTDLNLKNVILFGVENEYTIHVFDRHGQPYPAGEVESMVRSALCARMAGRSLRFLESHGGFALAANGGRAYWDRLGRVSAAEYSTPEVRSPLDACAYVQAGHRFYRDLAGDVLAAGRDAAVELYLSGTCLKTGNANGVHLNYYRAVDAPILELIPHLASLPCITSSGGFSRRGFASLQFVRSPRADLIGCVSGADSTYDRPLIDTYRKPYCRHGRRVQDMSADATHSMLPLYVRLGSTALLLAMVDLWGVQLDDLCPQDPLEAMRIWNRNPARKVPVQGGMRLGALDVQRRLLDLVRRQLDRPPGAFPDWSQEVVAAWERLLDAASEKESPDRTALDWAIHESLLRHVCGQHGFDWEQLPAISQAYQCLVELQHTTSPITQAEILRQSDSGRSQMQRVSVLLDKGQVGWDVFDDSIRWLQPILHLASTDFVEIGEEGIWRYFEAEMRRHLPRLTEDLIDLAGSTPPQDTRAKIRGEFVTEFAGTNASAGWDALVRPDGCRIDLSDPFATSIEA